MTIQAFFWTFFRNKFQQKVGDFLSFLKISLSFSKNSLSFLKISLSFLKKSLSFFGKCGKNKKMN